jgi:hypothetical protein
MKFKTPALLKRLEGALDGLDQDLTALMKLRDQIADSFGNDILAAEDLHQEEVERAAADLAVAIYGSDEPIKRYGLARALQDALAKIDALPLDARLKLTERRD